MDNKFVIFQTAVVLLIIHSATSECLESVLAGELPNPLAASHLFYDGIDSAYLFGGLDCNRVFNSIQRYNLTSGKTEEIGKLPFKLYAGAIIDDGNGNPVIIGGRNSNGESFAVLRYNRANESFTRLRELLYPLSYMSATLHGLDNVYVFGGDGPGMPYRSSIVKYDIHQKLPPTIVAQLPEGLFATTAVAFDKSIYLFGGRNGDFQDSRDIIKFTPKENNKVEVFKNKYQLGFAGASAVKVGDFIYVVGGSSSRQDLKLPISRFDPTTNTVKKFNLDFPDELYTPSAFYVQNLNRIYVIGGRNDRMLYSKAIYYIQLDYIV